MNLKYSVPIGVDLSEIDPDFRPASQMRVGLDGEAIQVYAESLEHMPPVTLMYDPTVKKHWLVDGCHTIQAAISREKTSILARVKQGSYLEAFAEAAKANSMHGVRLTTADKVHRVVEASIHPEMGRWSDRRLAEWCGVRDETVAKHRVVPVATFDSGAENRHLDDAPTYVIGKDGKSYPKRKRKPKPSVNSSAQPEPTPPTPPPPPSPVPTLTDEEEGPAQAAEFVSAPVPVPAPLEPKPIDWRARWDEEEKLFTSRFKAWPEDVRKLFAVKTLVFARKLAALYPDIIDKTDEHSNRKGSNDG